MPVSFKKIMLVVFIFIASFGLRSQVVNPVLNKMPAAGLRSDFLLLRDTMQKIHPAMYRYSGKKEIDHIFDSCYATIRDSMSLVDFYLLTRIAVAAIGDGHANSKLSRELTSSYMANTKLFPAMVLFIHNKAYIFCCKQYPSLNGTQLVSINGHPLKEIVQKLFSYITTDASIESRKNWELPEDFHLLFNTVYGSQERYVVSYKSAASETMTTTLLADTIKNFVCKGPFDRPARYLKLNYGTNNTAVLTLQTFFNGFLEQTGEDFKKFLDSAFDDIRNRKVKSLLIDVRSNQGGNDDNGALLYSYLSKTPFRYYSSLETVHGQFTENGHSLLGLQQPEKNHFDGKVFVLMNGRSFSGVAEFAAIARSNNRAKFIGEECGGGYYGNSSGDEAMVTLPHTQITARIPLIKYTMAVKSEQAKDGGIHPDYPIDLTMGDLIAHTDGQLEYAMKIASNDK
ncbi:MAG TPA: S41 family peptidase [Candidatus Paceibacterota bacterium]|nr:S41 family peptidase [Candidatus Paceibacterota bacterium]